MKRFILAVVLLASTIVGTTAPSATAATDTYYATLTSMKAGTNHLCPSGYKKQFIIVGTIQSGKSFVHLYDFELYTATRHYIVAHPHKLAANKVKFTVKVGRYTKVNTNLKRSWTGFDATTGAVWHATVSKRCYR